MLVTGASGFVGMPLTRVLARRGHRLRALVRDRRKAESALRDVSEFVTGDLGNADALRTACEGVDAVVHVAGLTKAARDEDFTKTNVDGTKRLAQAAVAAQVPRFLLVSSLAAAGASKPGRPRTESDEPEPVSAYGRSKLGGERAAAAIFTNTSVKFTIVRPPIVYGEGERDMLVAFQQVKRGFLPVVGGARTLQTRYSLVHVDDLVTGIAQAVESPGAGNCYFLPGPADASFLQIIEGIEGAVGRRARKFTLPFSAARPAAWIAQTAARALGKPSIVNLDKLREMSAGDWCCACDAAHRDLKYSPSIPIAEGFAREALWARSAGLL